MVVLELDLLKAGLLQVDALCFYRSTEGNSRKFCLVVLLLNNKMFTWYQTVADIYFGVVVGLDSMYVVNDFWRAPS